MQLSHMKIRYFRCFDNLEINFQTRDPKNENPSPMDALTVLVGRNGDGKTAVLDAINIAWNPFFRRLPVGKNKGFKESDRPSRPYETAEGGFDTGMPGIEAFFETRLFPAQGSLLDDGKIGVTSFCKAHYFNDRFCTRIRGKLDEVGTFLMGRDYNGQEIIWPLIAYDGDRRLWGGVAEQGKIICRRDLLRRIIRVSLVEEGLLTPRLINEEKGNPLTEGERREPEQHKEATLSQHREYAYDGSTNPKSGFEEFTRWFVELSHAIANKQGIYPQSSLEFYNILDKAVQDSLSEALKPTGWRKITCDDNDRIMAFNGDNIPVEVAYLSAGTRIVLGLVADIVFRCCKLNRHLRENVLKETTGIVLIDEIELHLHPSWQQEILPTLCKIFPRIQFIVTTHSPQVVSSVPAECIRILDGGKVLSPDIATEGARAEQILNDVFGTESRAKNDVSEKLSEYRGLINDGKWDSEEALQLKRFLHERLGSDPYLTRLEIEVRLKENQRRRANETH